MLEGLWFQCVNIDWNFWGPAPLMDKYFGWKVWFKDLAVFCHVRGWYQAGLVERSGDVFLFMLQSLVRLSGKFYLDDSPVLHLFVKKIKAVTVTEFGISECQKYHSKGWAAVNRETVFYSLFFLFFVPFFSQRHTTRDLKQMHQTWIED